MGRGKKQRRKARRAERARKEKEFRETFGVGEDLGWREEVTVSNGYRWPVVHAVGTEPDVLDLMINPARRKS